MSVLLEQIILTVIRKKKFYFSIFLSSTINMNKNEIYMVNLTK